MLLWLVPTGEPIVQAPAVIGDRVYFSTAIRRALLRGRQAGRVGPGGAALVRSRRVAVSRGKQGNTSMPPTAAGNTLILDAANGVQLYSMDTRQLMLRLTNVQNDPLYYATPNGLVQCFHEIGLKEPLRLTMWSRRRRPRRQRRRTPKGATRRRRKRDGQSARQ